MMEHVTLMCCSFNRAEALGHTVPNKLSVEGVHEVLFVLDGSQDGSAQLLAGFAKLDDRVKIIEKAHTGIQDSRNIGCECATGDWIIAVDDDDLVPSDFALKLLSVANAEGADIVGAPWLNATVVHVDALVSKEKDAAKDTLTLRDPQSSFTVKPIETPFLYSAALIRRSVALQTRFDPDYRGNSWREETDFYLRARSAGHKIFRSSDTYSWLDQQYSGGHSRKRVRYEMWVLINEIRFHTRHTKQLAELSDSYSSRVVEIGKTMLPRFAALVRGIMARAQSRVAN